VPASATWTKKASVIRDDAYTSSSTTLTAAPINNTSISDVIVVCINTGLVLSTVKIGGFDMTKVVEAGTGQVSIWQITGRTFTTPNIVLTSTGPTFGGVGITAGVLTGVSSTVPTGANLAVRAIGFFPNPVTTSFPLTVPTGGFGIVAYSQGSLAGVTPNAGLFEDYDLSTAAGSGGFLGLWMGYMTATGTPSVNGDPYIGSAIAAAAWGP